MTPPPEDFSNYATGAESARPADDEDLTSLPTGAESAGDTRVAPGSSSGATVTEADFEIVRELGRGGMGVVSLARHRRVRSRWFAVKTLRADKSADALFLKRFHREAEVLRGLRHVHIVVIHGASRPGEPPLMVLEYIPGPVSADPRKHPGWAADWPAPPLNLDELVGREGRLSPHRVAEIGAKLASALQAVHDRGLVHRDVKPPNVLIDTHGEPVLADFGLARDVDPASMKLTGSMDNLGTVFYVAPEVKRDPSSAGPPSDQFSLAVTLYAAATGDDPDVIRPEHIDARLYAVLARALSKNPDERYASAAEFGQALAKLRPAGSPSGSAADLAVLVCQSCGTANKDTDARCARCGKDLVAPCLKCSSATPLSRPACAKCGAVQAETFEALTRDADERFGIAAKCRREYQFQVAIDALKPVVALTHPRLSEVTNRARTEVKEVQADWSAWQKKIEEATAGAEDDFAGGRFEGPGRRFASIPAALWTPRMTLLVTEARDGPARQARATAELVAALARHADPYTALDADETAAALDLPRHFKRYVKGIRHHSQSALPDKMELDGAWAHHSRFAVLTSLYETRVASVVTRPYEGEPVPISTRPATEIDPWSCRLPIPNAMKSGTAEFPIPETQRVLECGACRGGGRGPCSGCNGSRSVPCPTCSGTKMAPCSTCRGKGREERVRKVKRFRDCRRCRGAGHTDNARCRECNGTGRAEFRDEERYTVPCGSCSERGHVPCRPCNATGAVACSICRSSGAVACKTCAGKRQLAEVWVVRQTFRAADQTGVPTQPELMPAEVFDLLQKGKTYAPVATVLSPELTPFGADLGPAAPSELTASVRALLAAAPAADRGGRLVRQRVVVHAAPGYQFTYRSRKKEYDCWLTSADGELFAPVNPVTDELERTVRAAAASDDKREAALVMRNAREMAEDDDTCAAALARVKGEVPDDVWAWSKAVWSEEKRNMVLAGAGGTAVGFVLLLLGALTSLVLLLVFGVLVVLVGGGAVAYGLAKSR
ncbi:MAG TPA: protein kinase [Gemmata sp.]